MARPKIAIHDMETNELVERVMTDEEFEQYESDMQLIRDQKIAEENAAAAKSAAKTTLLERLGMTAEEMEILLS